MLNLFDISHKDRVSSNFVVGAIVRSSISNLMSAFKRMKNIVNYGEKVKRKALDKANNLNANQNYNFTIFNLNKIRFYKNIF